MSSRGLGDVYKRQELALQREAIQKKVFIFQHNIIEEDLIYKRREDIVLSAVACSINEVSTGKQTKDSQQKTKSERLEVLVYNKNGELVGVKKEKGKPFPENKEGERRTFYFKDVTSSETLIELSLIHISEPTRRHHVSRMPSSA